MIRDEIEELLVKHPFEPFLIRVASGEQYEVRNSAQAALLKSAIFIAFPDSDRRVIVPFLHVVAIETLNGWQRPQSRKPKR